MSSRRLPLLLSPLAAIVWLHGGSPLGAQENAAARVPAFDGGLTCVIQVADLDRAIGWYRDKLGFALVRTDPQIGFAEVQTATGDVKLGLARHAEPSVLPGVVLTFGVHDIEAAAETLSDRGVSTDDVVTYPGLVKLLPFRDLAGNTLQLYESLQQAPAQQEGLAAVAFLAGSWVRADGDDRDEEHWTAPVGGLMVGMNRSVRGGRAVFFESLRIERDGDDIVFWATPKGQASTPFRLVDAESHARRAVFENTEHDFPQRVTYWLETDGSLRSRIEGPRDGKRASQDFGWQRGGLR